MLVQRRRPARLPVQSTRIEQRQMQTQGVNDEEAACRRAGRRRVLQSRRSGCGARCRIGRELHGQRRSRLEEVLQGQSRRVLSDQQARAVAAEGQRLVRDVDFQEQAAGGVAFVQIDGRARRACPDGRVVRTAGDAVALAQLVGVAAGTAGDVCRVGAGHVEPVVPVGAEHQRATRVADGDPLHVRHAGQTRPPGTRVLVQLQARAVLGSGAEQRDAGAGGVHHQLVDAVAAVDPDGAVRVDQEGVRFTVRGVGGVREGDPCGALRGASPAQAAMCLLNGVEARLVLQDEAVVPVLLLEGRGLDGESADRMLRHAIARFRQHIGAERQFFELLLEEHLGALGRRIMGVLLGLRAPHHVGLDAEELRDPPEREIPAVGGAADVLAVLLIPEHGTDHAVDGEGQDRRRQGHGAHHAGDRPEQGACDRLRAPAHQDGQVHARRHQRVHAEVGGDAEVGDGALEGAAAVRPQPDRRTSAPPAISVFPAPVNMRENSGAPRASVAIKRPVSFIQVPSFTVNGVTPKLLI
ncbi:hypothetical protein Ddc_18833 [Ditylenchus destructor]|nr:hypothetical protein Ddc_18833 [Ditylenchus destructor]